MDTPVTLAPHATLHALSAAHDARRHAPRRRCAAHIAAVLGALLGASTAAPAQTNERVPAPDEHAASRAGDPSARTKIVAAGDFDLAYYEIFDITGWVSPAMAPPEGQAHADPQVALAEMREREERRQRAQLRTDALAETVRTYMTPAFEEGLHDVHASGSVMVVLAGPAQHEWVQDFLDIVRAYDGYVMTQGIVYTAPAGTFRELGFADDQAIMDRSRAEVLQRDLEQRGISILTAPKLLTEPLQAGSISVLHTFAYVKDWELRTVQPGDQRIADPIIETLHEGLTLETRATPLGSSTFGVEVELELASVEQPFPTREVVLAPGLPAVQIALPSVTNVGLDTQLSIDAGQSVLFVTHDRIEDQELAVLLSFEQVDANGN